MNDLAGLQVLASTAAPARARMRLAPMLVLYADSTAERGARDALRNVVPGAQYAALSGLIGLGQVTADHRIIPRARFDGDEVPARADAIREAVVVSRTQLWDASIDLDVRRIDVHLLLAPDAIADLEAAIDAHQTTINWASEADFEGAFRVVTWFAPGFTPDAAVFKRLPSIVLLPPTRGAALLTREQRAEVLEALILDHRTSAVSHDGSVPRTIFPPLPFAGSLIVYHRAVSAGSLEKHSFAVGTLAAHAVARLANGLALIDTDADRTTDGHIAALEQSLAERRSAAIEAAAAVADNAALELQAGFAPSLFRALGPNDRASAAQAACARFLGPDGTPGSRVTYTHAAVASAHFELQQDGPQYWAERVAATSGGVARAAQVLRTALDRLPRTRGQAEPTIALDDAVLEPLINGVVYVRPPWYAVGPWIAVLAGLVFLLLEVFVPTERDWLPDLSAIVALAVGMTIGAVELARGWARRAREERTLGRPVRLIRSWALAWRNWLTEDGVAREQRLLLTNVLDVIVQRAAELTELHDD